MFSVMFVCLFVCEHYSKIYEWIAVTFYGGVWDGNRKI